MVLKCRCHGISGSCELKTCWRTLPSFSLIGKVLKEKYENSVQMTIKSNHQNKRQKSGNRRSSSSPSTASNNVRRRDGNYHSPNLRSRDNNHDNHNDDNNNYRSRDNNSYQTNNGNNYNNYNNNQRNGSKRRRDKNVNNHNNNNYPVISAGRRELVYLSRWSNINYCIADKERGILGTSGRVCTKDVNHGIDSPDSCYLLCCGRGYNTMIRRVKSRCDCKFEWCCNVTCNVCENETEIYTCK